MKLSLPRSFPGIGRVITLHVIERLPSRDVEPAQKHQVLTKDVDTGVQATNKDCANGTIYPSSSE